jgi:hypothetical protein
MPHKKKTIKGKWDDLFTDANPSDTINIKYKTLDDIKNTINILEKQYKTGNHTHKRISQIANLMKIRVGLIRNHSMPEYKLVNNYTFFLKQRTLKHTLSSRRKLIFKPNTTGTLLQ